MNNFNFKKDPVQNAINDGIRRSINVTIDQQCWGAAVVLIFAGIDAMANLARPVEKEFNDAEDFKEWVKRYLILKGQTQITPDEWWVARNAITHTFGAYAKGHKKNGIRLLGWMDHAVPPVIYKHNKQDLILVSIKGLRDAFFKGIETFLMEGFAKEKQKKLLEERLEQLCLTHEVSNSLKDKLK